MDEKKTLAWRKVKIGVTCGSPGSAALGAMLVVWWLSDKSSGLCLRRSGSPLNLGGRGSKQIEIEIQFRKSAKLRADLPSLSHRHHMTERTSAPPTMVTMLTAKSAVPDSSSSDSVSSGCSTQNYEIAPFSEQQENVLGHIQVD
ncbi:hypothetical protein H6P81_021167 [Aristolochia fimbriata]|uniref:Uncharacterized protein n=1 Tax=Aristolochia fimbriata TaxID=158543 RepID=A0AAV7DRK1_ARIFI|nr:hypothetical protein H6P81_021167 [Aristolochia fimbriata]